MDLSLNILIYRWFKIEMSNFSVIKILRIKVLKMVWQKYKFDVILNQGFIMLEPFYRLYR